LSNTPDAIEQARRDAQTLHERAHKSTAAKHADIRTNLETVAQDARRLQATLIGLLDSQQADTKQHLKNAANALDAGALDAKVIKTANDDDLTRLNATLRYRTAVALKRA
jgi:hypothetical protein